MKIEIYGSENCPNCKTAENLTKEAGFDYSMLKVEKDFSLPELFEKVGRRVSEFPQIFANNNYVGGISDYRIFLKENVKEDDSIDDLEI